MEEIYISEIPYEIPRGMTIIRIPVPRDAPIYYPPDVTADSSIIEVKEYRIIRGK